MVIEHKKMKTGFIIEYSYNDSEFGYRHHVDNIVSTSKSKIESRKKELEESLRNDFYKSNIRINIINVTID